MPSPEKRFDFLQSSDGEIVITPLIEECYTGISDVMRESGKPYAELHNAGFWEEFSTVDRLQDKMRESEKSQADWHVILGRGVIVGAIYDQRLPFTTPTTNIGYWVSRLHGGNGYATQAVILLSNYVLVCGDAETVIASPRIDNQASRRVLEKSGFTEQRVWQSRKIDDRDFYVTYEKRKPTQSS